MDVLNFMSYNSTGLDHQKVQWIQELITTCKIGCFQLQEHFKASKSVDSYFKQKFDKSESYVVPAHREILLGTGRAKGGLAQLIDKKLCIKKRKNSYKILEDSGFDSSYWLL